MIRVTRIIQSVIVALAKKGIRHISEKEKEVELTHNLLVSILVFVWDSHLFCSACLCCVTSMDFSKHSKRKQF